MWVNEHPGLTGFISQKNPTEMQFDSLGGGGASTAYKRSCSSLSITKGNKKKSSLEVMSDAVNNLAWTREVEFELHEKEVKQHSMMNVMLYTSMDSMLKCARTSEEIDLLGKKIIALQKKVDSSNDPVKISKYKAKIQDLEEEHNKVLMLDSSSDSSTKTE